MTPQLSFYLPLSISGASINGHIVSTGYYDSYFTLKQTYCAMTNNPYVESINITAPINDTTTHCDARSKIIFGLFLSMVLLAFVIFSSSFMCRLGKIINGIGAVVIISNVVICFLFFAFTITMGLAILTGLTSDFSLEGTTSGYIKSTGRKTMYKFDTIRQFISIYCEIIQPTSYYKSDTVNLVVSQIVPCYINPNFMMITYFCFLFIIFMSEIGILIWRKKLFSTKQYAGLIE
jgi:hypothetical protein